MAGVDFRCFWCCRAFFDKIKLEFADILEANKVDLKNVALTFQRLLQFPLRRALDYQKQLAAVANLYPAVSSASGVEMRNCLHGVSKKNFADHSEKLVPFRAAFFYRYKQKQIVTVTYFRMHLLRCSIVVCLSH